MASQDPGGRGPRVFGALGRWISRHPWYPIAFWIVALLVAAPFLPLLGSVSTSSTTTLPSNAPSAVAAQEFAELFPNQSIGTSTYLLFTGENMTGPHAQAVIANVTAALAQDRSLTYVAGISSVYTQYAGYLTEQALVAGGAIASSVPTLVPGINASAMLLWSPPAQFLESWTGRVANGTSPGAANYPAFAATRQALLRANDTAGLSVLEAFYAGNGSSNAGFNGSAACALQPAAGVLACADGAARVNEAPLIRTLLPSEEGIGGAALATLGIENFTEYPSIRGTAGIYLAPSVGLPAGWIGSVWREFPRGAPSVAAASAFANVTVARATLASEPIPVPYAIRASYVSGSGGAQLIVVAFRVGDSFTNAAGQNVVFDDLNAIDRQVAETLVSVDPMRQVGYVQTGGAALDLAQQNVVNSSLELVLPVTVVLLVVITALYFRSAIAPLTAFVGLSIALVLGLAAVVLLGTLVTHVDPTTFTLEEVFVLGIGTDYSIFLIARYREELVGGHDSREAVVTSVTWAGQSVATSGATAAIATLALAFSGVALLSQWGMVLSVAILITVLISLTITPALLTLLGPRVFWPSSGERFRRRAATAREALAAERTYFYRVGRLAQRRPLAIVLVLLLLSVPLVAIALNVPLSFDFYQQLPSSQPAVHGLDQLGSAFGPGFAFPSFALVTFSDPLVVDNRTNLVEFTDVADLVSVGENVSGIAGVASLVGPFGGTLSQWADLPLQPAAVQQNLRSLLPDYVGLDGRTVLISLQTSSSGLSGDAIGAIQSVESAFATFAHGHPEIVATAYSGAAPTTNDLAQQTLQATERMVLAVAIGLLAVLFVVLRSWIIPLMAVATIGLSIAWAWAVTYLVLDRIVGYALFFFVPTLLFILILGLGIDYNIFLLTRVREERVRGRSSSEAVVEAVGRTGGIISAAAVILACAFASLMLGSFVLLLAIGFSVAVAVLLDAMVVRTFLVPAALHLFGDHVWRWYPGRPGARRTGASTTAPAAGPPSGPVSP